ncbi:beta-1,4 N-acetylgalactosaminyltransferase 2-like [Ptychodera flava]|uniref:beta-1,4 N-acetylgalactosaminyltransferase 2-like n=1 Tax=Ptychodera flava TaxID=63121 RepID=UPI003969D8AF
MKTSTFFTLLFVVGLMVVSILYSGFSCRDDKSDRSIRQRRPVADPRIPIFKSFNFQMDQSTIPNIEHYYEKMKTGSSSCDCPGLKHGPLTGMTRERQRKEHSEWTAENERNREPIAVCHAMSPISYLGSGISVEPLESVRLVGLRFHHDAIMLLQERYRGSELSIAFKTRAHLGTLYVDVPKDELPNVKVEGNATYELEIITRRHADALNSILEHVIFNSTQYVVKGRETIDVVFLDFKVSVNILVQRSVIPVLHDTGPRSSDISHKVTVATKTFGRYSAVNRLVRSIEKRYPNVTIVIADDSKNPEQIQGRHVKQYMMPFAEGLNAGKNLALSQIRTKYFLWVDDDFVFTDSTKLELMLAKLESPGAELDLVAGMLQDKGGGIRPCGKENCWRTMYHRQGKDGHCVHKGKLWQYKTVEEFPNCQVLDLVTDFWMAKTQAVRKTGGFDIELERIGHREFFVDAIGQLRIAQCDDVSILHAPVTNKEYEKYRRMEVQPSEKQRYVDHLLFKNGLQCFESWFPKLISKPLLNDQKRT